MPQLKSTKKKPATAQPQKPKQGQEVPGSVYYPGDKLSELLTIKNGEIVFTDGRPFSPRFSEYEGLHVTVGKRDTLQNLLQKQYELIQAHGEQYMQLESARAAIEINVKQITDLLVRQSALVEQVEQLERQLRDERCARGALELAIELLGKGLGTR